MQSIYKHFKRIKSSSSKFVKQSFIKAIYFIYFSQDTDILKATAKRFVKTEEYQKAAEKYREILTIMNEFMAPPFKDYCNIQQSYKECLLQNGNKNVHFKE